MAPPAAKEPRRILLIEDDPHGGAFLEQILGAEGYATRLVPDGEEAVAAAGEFRPDLIVTDVYMPRMNGIDALIALQPRRTGTPVIVISGAPFTTPLEPYELSEALGAARFLPKPLRREQFLWAVKDLLERGPTPRT